MSAKIDLTGKRYGRLIVIGEAKREKGGHLKWECLCDCGNKTVVSGSNLKSGHIRSCGCLAMETHYKHGYAKNGKTERLYSIWRHMIERCHNEKCPSYSNYGARGIFVCEEWRNDVDTFIKWAKENGYKKNLTIDRIDNNKGYCPENCKWSTVSEQANNRRTNNLIEYKGQTKTLMQWLDELDIDISYTSLQNRFAMGWSAERAFNEPVNNSETGKRGVSIRRDGKTIRYRAYIYVDKKRIYLGTYKTLEEAVSAREAAEEKYLGKKEGD